ncbi:hypothetical protein O6H91_06G128900 [Diphasiastrum complanatum]|uniref:Uncharacterized protein n=4 Tax=Diphasiastrum complanatum TaxID=34168 RepID=A0ACC2DJB1_DIPCM|nr:hypothetical protein O6H91_06G128900 [Diphasiastrum complanatum]KAJ7554167.1 hypothetical protein O6H91_06G128900 [Diphasiastrum complanatum]KAJ7554168.1 hypothetical protein O6H91_06G128900 [Diphasiastrum complanatum]KAJ7554169.1 hypothetical protein O6H91_06G128900 [Diphasiastrum complanatum]
MNTLSYAKGITEEDVDELMSQFQDESLLKLSVNTHNNRSIPLLEKSNIHYPVQDLDDSGLHSDLVARYAKLKVGKSGLKPNISTQPGKAAAVKTCPSAFQSDHGNAPFDQMESDTLSAELEARLRALKSHAEILPSASDSSTQTRVPDDHSITSAPSNLSHQVRPTPTSQAFCSFGNDHPNPRRCVARHEDEKNDDLESAVADVKKLLRSVKDEIRLEKEERNRQKKDMKDILIEEDSRLFNVEEMEEEYVQASMEEDRLSRAAEEVVKWAKDAARLGGSDSEEDLENDDNDLSDMDDTLTGPVANSKKKDVDVSSTSPVANSKKHVDVSSTSNAVKSQTKKAKRWSLFK